MPTVEEGKCSDAAAEKDFWRARMVSACWESRGCCWVFETFCAGCQMCGRLGSGGGRRTCDAWSTSKDVWLAVSK